MAACFPTHYLHQVGNNSLFLCVYYVQRTLSGVTISTKTISTKMCKALTSSAQGCHNKVPQPWWL